MPDLALENRLWAEGFRVVGADEAGRGTWAGSLWVGTISLRHQDIAIVQEMLEDYNLNDSKLMTPPQRARVYRTLLEERIPYAVADATVGEIDALGIEGAFNLALNRAGESLMEVLRAGIITPQDMYAKTCLLIDGSRYRDLKIRDTGLSDASHFEVVAEDKLDGACATVALASIVAKVHQEITMRGLDLIYPEYGFASHNGYPTEAHKKAVRKHDLSAVHRQTWNVKL